MGTKRQDGRWMARVRYAGRRYAFYGDTHAQAEAAAAEFRRRVQGHAGPTVQDWLQQWIGQRDSLNTRVGYAQMHALYLGMLDPLPLTALTVLDCQAAVDTAPMGSRRKAKAVLRAALNDAMRAGLLDSNPATLVKVPAYKSAGNPLSQADARLLLAHTGRLTPLYRVALGTGLRHGELLALEPGDFQNGQLIVRRSKTKAGVRRVPVPLDVVPCLSTIASDTAIFATEAGTPYKDRYPLTVLYRACAAAGIERRRMHDLRHTYATWLLERDVPLHKVSKLLGHASLAVTADIYGHVVPSDADVSVLDGLL